MGFRVMWKPHNGPRRSHLVTRMLHAQSRGGSLKLNLYPKMRPDSWVESVSKPAWKFH